MLFSSLWDAGTLKSLIATKVFMRGTLDKPRAEKEQGNFSLRLLQWLRSLFGQTCNSVITVAFYWAHMLVF